MSRLKSRLAIISGLALIAVGAVAVRFLHLLPGDHYYILSVDSYFFFWMAEKIVAGEAAPMTWHSGLAYPLAYLANLITFVTGIPPSDALTIACKSLPPVLGVISVIVIYLAGQAIYGRRVGIFAAFTMAFLPHAYFIQAAGYVDRDGLSTLLIMIGAFAFYLLKAWKWRIGKLNVGWLLGGILVAAIGELVFRQWVWVGRWLLLFIVAVFFVSLLGKGFLRSGGTRSSGDRVAEEGPEAEPDAGPASGGDSEGFLRGVVARGATAVKESPWRLFLVVIGLSGLFELAGGGLRAFISRAAWSTETIAQALPDIESIFQALPGIETVAPALPEVEARIAFEMPIAELQGLSVFDVLGSYQVFLIPLAIGLVIAFLKRRDGDLFCLSWFLGLLILSLTAQRILITAIPAVCILCGVGLDFVFKARSSRAVFRYPQAFVAVGLIYALLISSSWGAYNLGDSPRMAPHEDWQSALTYLRESTAEDAVVMSWWDYGYWILALGERRPVVDGGFYGWTEEKLQDIGLAYVTSDPSEIVAIMEKYGADYFVFSWMEMDIFPAIARAAFSGREYIPSTDFLVIKNPLYLHFLRGDFRVKGPLEVAYRNPGVVILRERPADSPP